MTNQFQKANNKKYIPLSEQGIKPEGTQNIPKYVPLSEMSDENREKVFAILDQASRVERIKEYQSEAEAKRQEAEKAGSFWGTLKQTIFGLPSAAKKVFSRKGVISPKGISAATEGAFETTVLSPVSALTSLATKGKVDVMEKWKEFVKPWEETLTPEQKEIRKGFRIGGEAGLYALSEAGVFGALSKLGKFKKVAPAASYLAAHPRLLQAGKFATGVGTFVGTGQVLHRPEDGPRAKAALQDAALSALFPIVGKAVEKSLKPATRYAMRKVESAFSKVVKKKVVPLKELEGAVKKANYASKKITGKTPEEIIKTEIAPKISAARKKIPIVDIRKRVGTEKPLKLGKPIKGFQQAAKPAEEAIKIAPKRVRVPRSFMPVGEGKKQVSKLEKRIVERLKSVPKNVRENLATYNQMAKPSQMKKSAKYVSKNEDDAMKVLFGEKSVPKGLLYNSIYIAMEEKLKSRGDAVLLNKLASLKATRFGQEISILSELNPHSPTRYIKELKNWRKKIIGYKDEAVLEAKKAALIKKAETFAASKNHLKFSEWESFIKSITC